MVAMIYNNAMNRYETSIRELAEQYRVFCFYSFGSRGREVLELVRGERQAPERSTSDIDIGVHYRKGCRPELNDTIHLMQALEDIFQAPRVDLVDITLAPCALALEIIQGELIYCSDEIKQAEYELYVLRCAGDQAFLMNERYERIIKDGFR